MANYFMNMYSVSPVLSAQSVVPLSTINHSDAVAISIPSAPNISNNNAVRTSHPHTSHANTHSHMHMVAQPTIVGHRTVQHAAHNSSQQQQQSHGTSHAGHATQHQATTTGAQRSATASRTMTVPCDTPYVCGVCNQGFRKPGSLKKHMRVHMSANVSCDPVSSTDIVINSNAFFCFFFVFCIFFVLYLVLCRVSSIPHIHRRWNAHNAAAFVPSHSPRWSHSVVNNVRPLRAEHSNRSACCAIKSTNPDRPPRRNMSMSHRAHRAQPAPRQISKWKWHRYCISTVCSLTISRSPPNITSVMNVIKVTAIRAH